MAALKNTEGASFCHYCRNKLIFAKKPFDFSHMHSDKEMQAKIKKRFGEHDRYSCVELMTPGEPSYLIRVHKQCAPRAIEDGYRKPKQHEAVRQTSSPSS